MEIKISNNNEIKNIILIGNLDGNSSEQTANTIINEIYENIKLVIDMTMCTYVSSAGLRALLMIGKNVKMKSGTLKFLNLSDEVKDVMEMTGFLSIFMNFEN